MDLEPYAIANGAAAIVVAAKNALPEGVEEATLVVPLEPLGLGARQLFRITDLFSGGIELRSRERKNEWPGDERVVLQAAHLVGDDRAPDLFRDRGFVRVRSFFRMVADVSREPPAPEWPGGVELRPFDPDRHGRALHAALEEAFVQEWEHVAQPYEAWRERAFQQN